MLQLMRQKIASDRDRPESLKTMAAQIAKRREILNNIFS